MHLEALEPLLHDAPPDILKYILGQFSKVSSIYVMSFNILVLINVSIFLIYFSYQFCLHIIFNIYIYIYNNHIYLIYKVTHFI